MQDSGHKTQKARRKMQCISDFRFANFDFRFEGFSLLMTGRFGVWAGSVVSCQLCEEMRFFATYMIMIIIIIGKALDARYKTKGKKDL